MADIIDFETRRNSLLNEGVKRISMKPENLSQACMIHRSDSERDSVRREERKEHLRRHRKRIYERAHAKPKLSDAERLQVARNLYGIIKEAKSDGINIIDVLTAANQHNEDESTKRLYVFSIDPKLRDTKTERRREPQLRRKTEGYVRIAQAVAQLRRLPDENALLPALFSGTSYSDEAEHPEDLSVETYASAFQELVSEMVETLSISFDLTSYFERVHRHNIPSFQLDPEKYWIEQWGCQVHLAKDTVSDFVYPGETGGLPTVGLYRMRLRTIAARVRISEEPIADADELCPTIPAKISFHRWRKAKLEIWQELRLSICPVIDSSMPRAFFEMRYAPVIKLTSQEYDLRARYIDFENGNFPAIDEKLQHLGQVQSLEEIPRSHDDPFDVEPYYTRFFSANAAHSKQFLGRRIDSPVLAPEFASFLPSKVSGGVGFPADSIGAAVEEGLYNGSLEQQLEWSINHCKESLERFLAIRDEDLAKRRAAARDRWRRM